MRARLNSPDPKHEVAMQNYDEDIPLAFNVIYYVEGENDALNAVMRQMAENDGLLFENAELQPYPFILQYVAQSELDAESLRAKLSAIYTETELTEAVRIARHCFAEEKTGTLLARCLPRFHYDNVFEDDHAVNVYTGFNLSSPQEVADNARWFARETAKLNFYRLSGVSYEAYLESKKPQRNSSQGRSGGFGYMSFLVREKTPQEITATRRRHAEELAQLLEQYNYDEKEKTTILEIALQLQKSKGKLTDIRTLSVEDEKIYIYLSDNQKHEISFRRTDKAKMLYIFFLILIKREAKYGHSRYITQADLENYKDDLLEIYKEISCYYNVDIKNIESVWDKSDGDFSNSLSSIRGAFKEIFKDETAKRYSIERHGKDPKFGSWRYGIDLEVANFNLGSFEIMV